MIEDDIKHDILSIIDKKPQYYYKEIKSKYKNILDQCLPNKSISEQIYVYLNGKKTCEICGSVDLYFLSLKDGYSATCSKKCGYKLRELTFMQDHGVKNIAQLPKTQKKTKKTIDELKLKDPNYIKKIVEKRKSKNIEKYGVDNYTKTDEYKIKCEKTSLEKYGTKSPNQSPIKIERYKDFIQEKYGVDNISQNPEIKRKKEDTCMKNYGVPYYAKSEEARNQFKINNNHHTQLVWSETTRNMLLDAEKLAKILEKMTPVEVASLLGVGYTTVYNYAIKYGIRTKYIDFSTENIIQTILRSCGVVFEKNNRTQIKPKELDFYLPEYNLGIEVCGLFWHSEKQGKTKDYHLNKLRLCEEKGIRLLTIFEDELSNFEKLENKLKNILGKSSRLTVAKKCSIREISSSDAKIFFTNTHLQNHVNGKIYLGAFYKNKLVAAMSFGTLRKSLGSKNEDNTYELLRYACVDSIPGIGSKLFTHFIRQYNPEKIISYCDRRWSSGNFYTRLNFMLEKNTMPNYWYMKNYKVRQHRYSFTKQRLVNLGGDKKLTEWENAQNYGLDRIWDCGSSKWVWLNNR